MAFVIAFGLGGAASAQSLPDGENGRYALSPAPDGVLRLDTRTGAVSTCTDKGQGWACYAIPDERAALDAEIGRLHIDNDRLKAALAQRAPAATGKIGEPLPNSDALRQPEISSKDGARKLEIPLPSERDVDRAMTFLERVWRRLIEIAGRVQKDAEGKI
jgi:hypothetical protein